MIPSILLVGLFIKKKNGQSKPKIHRETNHSHLMVTTEGRITKCNLNEQGNIRI